MNRAAASLILVAFLAAAGAAVAPAAAPDTGLASPLPWINEVRASSGLSTLSVDSLLSEAAARWSAVLAASGMLTHRGAGGSSVLDRYRAVGGTEAHVGEIIGAGPDLAAVERGWEASEEHRTLVCDDGWTHAGWGMTTTRGAQVWVVLFCQKLVDGLTLDDSGGRLRISGAFLKDDAVRAALIVGLDPLPPGEWDPASRRFAFVVPPEAIPGYFRLGYVTSDGAFLLTNAFTWPP